MGGSMSESAESKILGIAKVPNKLRDAAPLTLSSLTLGSVIWMMSLLYQNFSKVQDQLVDAQSKTVVLEQQVGALKDKLSAIEGSVKSQDNTRAQLSTLELQFAVLKSTTELRLAEVETRKAP